jgi:hypothetical protein
LLPAENAAIARLRANRAADKGIGGAGQTRLRRNVSDRADKYQVKNFRGFRSVASDTEEKVQDTIGLALSGGGIRSAAFCLGALQALDIAGVLRKVDYLSTVSGGGYIGTCMTAAMQFNGGQFPFPSKLKRRESPSLQHIRDNSNYLFPKGPFDMFRNGAIYARGLLANFIIVGIFLFFAAGLTLLFNPTPGDLEKPGLLASILGIEGATGFKVTVHSDMGSRSIDLGSFERNWRTRSWDCRLDAGRHWRARLHRIATACTTPAPFFIGFRRFCLKVRGVSCSWARGFRDSDRLSLPHPWRNGETCF